MCVINVLLYLLNQLDCDEVLSYDQTKEYLISQLRLVPSYFGRVLIIVCRVCRVCNLASQISSLQPYGYIIRSSMFSLYGIVIF